MAQKRKTTRNKSKKQKQQQEHLHAVLWGVFFVFFGLFGLLKLGFLGTLIANVLRVICGNLFPIAAIFLIIYGVLLIIFGPDYQLKKVRLLVGANIFFLGILLFLHAYLFRESETNSPAVIRTTWSLLKLDIQSNRVFTNVGGGMVGAILYSVTFFLVAQFGSYLCSFLLIITGIYLMSMMEFQQILESLNLLKDNLKQSIEDRENKRKEKQTEKNQQKEANRILMEEKMNNSVVEEADLQTEKTTEPVVDIVSDSVAVPIDYFQSQTETIVESVSTEENGDLAFNISPEIDTVDYELPPSSLLDTIRAEDQSGEYKKIEKNIGVLEQTFQSFGVDAKVVKASLGPSVTKFEIQPAVGVKVSKIVGLTDDIALALAAKDVRMEAPIPGKSLIGIEVPNSTVSMVSFRDIVEAQPNNPEKLLEVPLGRDISGMVQVADLTKMPHMLIAGSTGSGKSVAINGIICSILMRAKPNEVKLMMIDPKMVELNVYNGIPHLLTPVVTNPRKAAQALQKVVQEMEYRYEKFAATGVRNIFGYNECIVQRNQEFGENNVILPLIVVIVDELADLMMVASNEVEDAIIRLAQMARAAGIHMILATQRPSVDVITGIIKANVPSRMAFAVSSGTDSRTIIDTNGAEKLLGRGDMLFLPMGENKPIRVQGAFLSDQEVERIVSFVTEQQGADYQEDMMPTEEISVSENQNSSQDELYEEAKTLVIEMQTASISLLQRRFRIGYNRAARLIDELEGHGVIGPTEGSKPRKVLIEPIVEATKEDY